MVLLILYLFLVFTWVASDVAAKISTLNTYNTGDKKENFQVKRQLINLSLYTLYFKIDMLVYIYLFYFVFSCR